MGGREQGAHDRVLPGRRGLFWADGHNDISRWDLATARVTATYRSDDPSSGVTVVRGGMEQKRFVTRVADGVALACWEGPTDGMVSSPDGRLLACLINEPWAGVYEATSGATLFETGCGPTRIAFCEGGAALAAVDYKGTLRVWDTATWRLLLERPCDSPEPIREPDHTYLDGRYLGGHTDDARCVWEVMTGRRVLRVPNDPTMIRDWFAASRDGRHGVLVGSSVQLWSLDGQPAMMHTLDVPFPCWEASFSHDGRWLTTVCGDRGVLLWEVATGRALGPLEGGISSPRALVWSPDDTRIAVLSWRGLVRLWDRASRGALVSLLTVGRDGVAFTGDSVFHVGEDAEGIAPRGFQNACDVVAATRRR